MTDPLDAWMSTTGARGVVLAHNQLPERWGVALPASDRVGLHALLRGEAWVRPHGGEAVQLHAGDVVLLPAGPAHQITSHPDAPAHPLNAQPSVPAGVPRPTTLLCGEYSGSRCPVTSLWRDLPPVMVLRAATLAKQPRVATLLGLLSDEVESDAPGSEALIASLLDALMVYLMRAWSDHEPGWHAGLGAPELAPTLRRLHSRPAHPWTVDELARSAGMSRATFSQHFRQNIGEPPMSYLRRWRMAIAAKLLIEDDAPVGLIAERVGYTSEFAFNRAFKKVIGAPPGQYRRGQLAS